jgi:hypothetical protein
MEMKKGFFMYFLAFLISFSSFASTSFIAKSRFNECPRPEYLYKEYCEKVSNEKCLEVPTPETFDCGVFEIEEEDGVEKLIVNEQKKELKDAEEKKNALLEDSIRQAKKLRDCGGRVMDVLLVRNSTKGLTTAQVKQIVATYAPVKALLETGSLNSAKEEILAVSADGLLITEEDKTALIAEINSCIGQ